jgi:2-polyprenyl-3-methyl-5-hydroxy-6-metoxy-1,4-benzoquinol methylase
MANDVSVDGAGGPPAPPEKQDKAFRCPLCGGTQAQPRFGPLLTCRTCGLVCTDPAYTAPPAALYGESYYTQRNAYLEDSAVFLKMFGRILDHVQERKAGGRLLDVGCGVGQLLQVAQARGYQVAGCDISAWATDYARGAGYDVRTGTLEEIHYEDSRFDIAVASHTLEHVPAPLPFLQEVRRVLRDDGLLVIAVPNFASVMAQTLRNHWAGLLPDQHLWHFTPKTLEAMLHKAGFQTLEVTSDPYLHHHPNFVKDAALVALSGFGSLIGRSDYMTAYAAKQPI